VCQDYAHLAVAMCRSIGIPARYVSGYLFTLSDASGVDADVDVVRVQTHAWFEAAIPGFGWLALDPTNQQEVGLRHVKIGHGRDYDDVPPMRGVFAGGAVPDVDVTVEIRRMMAASTVRNSPPPGLVNAPATPRILSGPDPDDDQALQHQHQSQQQQ
jgi:transglutaminase-like putative cysteine protease